MDRIHQPHPQPSPATPALASAALVIEPTPVDQDPTASTAELQQRAAADYTDAQHRREQLSREDRVHGNETGSNR